MCLQHREGRALEVLAALAQAREAGCLLSEEGQECACSCTKEQTQSAKRALHPQR